MGIEHVSWELFEETVRKKFESSTEKKPGYQTDHDPRVKKSFTSVCEEMGLTMTSTVMYWCFHHNKKGPPGNKTQIITEYDGIQIALENGKRIYEIFYRNKDRIQRFTISR